MSIQSTSVNAQAAFGYLRRLPGMGDEAVRGALDELVACARRHGLELAGAHYEESVSERLSTWCRLIADCRNEEIVHVVVPSSEHFHDQPNVADFMREELATAIHGTVWIADERAHPATGETEVHHAE